MERRNIRRNPRNREGRRAPGANRARQRVPHHNLPDLLEGAEFNRRAVQALPAENPAPNPDVEAPVEQERHDQNNDQLEHDRQRDVNQRLVADHQQQFPEIQIRPQGAVMNLVLAGIAAGSAVGLHQNRSAALEAQPPVVEQVQGHICQHENRAHNSGGPQNVRQQVHEDNRPVEEHQEQEMVVIPRFASAAILAASVIPLGVREVSSLQLLHPNRRFRPASGLPPSSVTDRGADSRRDPLNVRYRPVYEHQQLQGIDVRPEENRNLILQHSSTGNKRRLQPQPSTSQQAAPSCSRCEPVRDQLRCNFCPLPATHQRVDYTNLPHELSNFDAITVDNLAMNFCKRVLATCPAARRYVRSIQSMPPNHLPRIEVTPRECQLQNMYHGPFCPIDLIRNWPDPPFTPPVQHPIPLPENLRGWDPVSIKKAKKSYCKEVLKHNPCALEELTGVRSISPDPSSASAESSAITDSVHHRDASCPLILFDRCLPCRSDCPPSLEIRSPESARHFRSASAIGRKKDDSLGTQTGCPGLPKPLPSLQSTPQGIAGPSQPTDPVSKPKPSMRAQLHLDVQSQQDCHLCSTASTSRSSSHPRPADCSDGRYNCYAGRHIMWGLCREILLNTLSDPERVTRARSVSPDRLSPSESIAYRSVVGTQTIQHHPLCVVSTHRHCPYCNEFQQSDSSELSSTSRSSDPASIYVRITCVHHHGCPVEILGYCPECRVEPTRSDPHPVPSEPQVEAVEVEEQHHENGTSQNGSYPTPSEPQVEDVDVEEQLQESGTSKSGPYPTSSEPQVEDVEVEEQLQESETSQSGSYPTPSEPQVEDVEVEEQLQESETSQSGSYPAISEPQVEAVEAEEQLQDSETSQSGSYPTLSESQVEAVQVEEQLQESGTSQSTSSTEPTTQDDQSQFLLRIIRQNLDDDNNDDDVSTWL